MLLTSAGSFAANVDFIKIENVFFVPQQSPGEILPYSIILESSQNPINKRALRDSFLRNNLTYLTRIKVDQKTYYRLVTGNFKNPTQARPRLNEVKKYFPQAWVNFRTPEERRQLARLIKPVNKKESTSISTTSKKISRSKTSTNPPDKLLELAKQAFLDKNYSRVLALSNQVLRTGNPEQIQRAMELTGIVRERQNQFAEAISIYKDFLLLHPESEIAPRIQSRLDGLETMLLEPRANIEPKHAPEDSNWTINGAFSQYYRDITIQSENDRDADIVHSALATDIDLLATRKTDSSTLVMLIDGGIYRDIEEEKNDSRLGQALIKYTDRQLGYQLTGGRQRGTARGVYSRFEGLVYKGLSQAGFDYSIYFGTPVQSAYDNAQTDRRFAGTSLHFRPFSQAEMSIYLMQQNYSDLTDRQTIGTEFEYRRGSSYLLNLIDYDLFYDELNNLTLLGSFPYNEKLSFNLSYDYHLSPLLATANALAGQPVSSMEALKDLFSDEEIYQLAEDRTSRGHNFNIGSNYQIDVNRNLYLSLSYASLEETNASGGVPETPATEYVNFAADYSISGFFYRDDSTSVGLRISDTDSTNVISLRARSYIRGLNNFAYDPRLRFDFRENKDSGEDQWILNPSMKLIYRPSRSHSFEASIGIEYFIYDSSHLDDQTTENLLLAYFYQF